MENRTKSRFQEAIASGEFAKAERLWFGHMTAVEQSILEGSASAEDVATAGRLLDWARLIARCGHAHLDSRIRALRTAAAYSCTGSRKVRTRALL